MFTVEDKYEESKAVQAMDRTQIVPMQDTTNITQIAANGPPGDRFQVKQGRRATTTMISDMEGSQSLEGLEAELDEIVAGKQKPDKPHRTINEKQYVTLGVLQGAAKGLEEDSLVKKGGRYQDTLQGGT